MTARNRRTNGQFSRKGNPYAMSIILGLLTIGMLSLAGAMKIQAQSQPCKPVDAKAAIICEGKVYYSIHDYHADKESESSATSDTFRINGLQITK